MSESLENFTNIVKEDIKEAKTLFFSEAFKEEYLKDRREEKELYHQLLLGRNRNQILEEFLLSSGQKKPVLLSAAKTIYQATIMNLDEPLEIKVKREGWGYLVGRIKSDGTFLSLHKNTFQAYPLLTSTTSSFFPTDFTSSNKITFIAYISPFDIKYRNVS